MPSLSPSSNGLHRGAEIRRPARILCSVSTLMGTWLPPTSGEPGVPFNPPKSSKVPRASRRLPAVVKIDA